MADDETVTSGVDEMVGRYEAWISRTGLAASTRRRYPRVARAFGEYVADGGDRFDGAWTDPDVRDYAVAEYRRHLLTERNLAPASVAAYLAAITSLYEWIGLGRPHVDPIRYVRATRRGITDTDRLRAILRVAKTRGPRDYAITVTFMLCGPRLGELVALDVDDIHLTAATGLMDVRYGKGGQPRQIPVPRQARTALRNWIKARRVVLRTCANPVDVHTGAMFVSRDGARLSGRAVQDVIAAIGRDTGTKLSPHVLRQTYGRRWVESGGDIVALKNAMGHQRLTTTETYTQPDDTYLANQAERLAIET